MIVPCSNIEKLNTPINHDDIQIFRDPIWTTNLPYIDYVFISLAQNQTVHQT